MIYIHSCPRLEQLHPFSGFPVAVGSVTNFSPASTAIKLRLGVGNSVVLCIRFRLQILETNMNLWTYLGEQLFGTSFQFDLKPFRYDVCRCITCDTIHMYRDMHVQSTPCCRICRVICFSLISWVWLCKKQPKIQSMGLDGWGCWSWMDSFFKMPVVCTLDPLWAGWALSKHQLRPWPTKCEGKKTVCKTASSEVFSVHSFQ